MDGGGACGAEAAEHGEQALAGHTMLFPITSTEHAIFRVSLQHFGRLPTSFNV